MPWWKFGRGKKKEEDKPLKEEEPKQGPSLLEKICIKHGRPDLYEPLSYTLLCDTRGRDLDKFLADKTILGYSVAGSVYLHQTKDKEGEERQKLLNQARECFDAGYKLRNLEHFQN